MNKDWDASIVSIDTWKECLRVLKPGAFAFIMCTPRQDILARQIINLQDAGFKTNFTSIYWTYASGFPKAANVSKLVDKRGYENERYSELTKELCDYLKTSREKQNLSQKDIAKHFPSKTGGLTGCVWNWENGANIPTMEQWHKLKQILNLTNDKFNQIIERAISKREEAEREIIGKKPWDGSRHHFLPGANHKERVHLNETKSATEAAKRLDGSYCGYQPKPALETILVVMKPLSEKSFVDQALKNGKGISWLDDVRIPFRDEKDIKDSSVGHVGKPKFNGSHYNNGKPSPELISNQEINEKGRFPANLLVSDEVLNGHSKYFDLDAWFLAIPKASPSERQGSTHPTMKPIKLMSYLITMGSRPNDIILDPFIGSGTTAIAALQLGRRYIGIEQNKEYVDIARKRLEPYQKQKTLLNF